MAYIRTKVGSGILALGLVVSLLSMPLSVVRAEDASDASTMPIITTTEQGTEPVAHTATTQPEPTTTSTAETPPAAPAVAVTATPGPQQPPGADTSTYTYNESTGLWENQYYTWDPATKMTAPKQQQDYSFNPSTGMWDTTEWAYNPATSTYIENPKSVSIPPTSTATPTIASVSSTNQPSGGDIASEKALSVSAQPTTSVPTLLPVNGNSSVINNGHGLQVFDYFYDARISTDINSTATTGDASVQNNTTGGSATSGDASVVANVFNYMNSSINLMSAVNPLYFMANVVGSVFGDLFINPGNIPSSQKTDSAPSDVVINSKQSGLIENNIALSAASGNADVSSNTRAGSATTGDAYAMANVTNVINSAIGAQQSFIGLINIQGDLNGDILFPDGFLDQILASNGQNSLQQTATINDTSLHTDLQSTQNIQNNIQTAAHTGNANVINNTSAGNATSGNAQTQVNIFNLTGRQVIGTNALLVFVNVLGNWVGLIMDAPSGTTAGLIGDGTSQSTTSQVGTDVAIQSSADHAIVNNIDVAAHTGDATVQNNTFAGDATSGAAHATVNVLNISSSTFSLGDWFGILFINVLGNWYGSFGVDTMAGNPIVVASSTSNNASSPTDGPVFTFVPTQRTTQTSPASAYSTTVAGEDASTKSPSTIVLAGSKSGPPTASTRPATPENTTWRWSFLVIGIILSLLILFEEKIRAYAKVQRLKIAQYL